MITKVLIKYLMELLRVVVGIMYVVSVVSTNKMHQPQPKTHHQKNNVFSIVSLKDSRNSLSEAGSSIQQ